MKIVNIEPILVSVPYLYNGGKPGGTVIRSKTDILLVRVDTDDGIVGWGEAFALRGSRVTHQAFVDVVIPLALGRDTSDIAGLMTSIQRVVHNVSRNGPIEFALSGLDIALWDIAAKRAGQPLYKFLGGAQTDKIPAYASLYRHHQPDVVARDCAAAKERGYQFVKLHEHDIPEVKAARDALGPHIGLMVDVNCAWTVEEAIEMAKGMQPHNIFWLEEPSWPPEDYAGLRRIRTQGGIPTAAGENGGVLGLEQMMAQRVVDYVQPSVTKMGGITPFLKVIERAKQTGVAVMPHSPIFGPGLVASIHIIAGLLPGCLCELRLCDIEASPLGDAIVAENGEMRVPQGPGLGINIDEGVVSRYRLS